MPTRRPNACALVRMAARFVLTHLVFPPLSQDVDVHPAQPLIAVGLVTGRFQLWQPGAPTPSFSLRASTAPARAVAFSADGTSCFVADAAGTLLSVDTATGKPTGRLAGASGAAFSRAAPAAALGGGVPSAALLTGDDAGAVALWDLRSPSPLALWTQAHDDYVGDVVSVPGTGCAVSVGGDGVLRVLDVRAAAASTKPKHESASDPDEDELTCVAVTDAGARLAAGSAGGVVSLWAWGAMKGCADRWPLPKGKGGRPAFTSVTARSHAGSRTLLAGCDDGALRVVSVLPTACPVSVAAAHGRGAPSIERVRAGGDDAGTTVATIVAACREVRVWDGRALFGAGDEARDDVRQGGKRKRGGDGSARPGAASFFADLL